MINTVAKIIGYANDFVLLFSETLWEKLFKIISYDAFNIINWFMKNGLSVNFNKTKAILFGCYINSLPICIELILKG